MPQPLATNSTEFVGLVEETIVALAAALSGGGEGGVADTVNLSTATLNTLQGYLQAIGGSVSITNFPATQPVSGTVALDATSLAALETINVIVQSGTLELGSTTLAALETINAVVSGTVNVGNFPVEYPLPASQVTALTPIGMAVNEALNFTSFDLQSAAFSQTTNMTVDYQADKIELHFTSRASRTVTVTTEDGTVLRQIENNTSRDLDIDLGKRGFEAGEQITLAITQTSTACLVTGKLVTTQGSAPLVGSTAVTQATSPWLVRPDAPVNVRAISRFYNVRGQRFIATTDYVPLSLNTSNQLLALFQNPADSGKVVMFDKAEFASTVNSSFTRFGGGTASLIGSPVARPIGRTDGGTSASVMKIYTGGNNTLNVRGTTVPAQFSVSAAGTVRKVAVMQAYAQYQLNEIDGTLVLQPGQQSYWVVDEVPGGGSGTFNALIDFEWVEIPTANWDAMVTALQAMTEY